MKDRTHPLERRLSALLLLVFLVLLALLARPIFVGGVYTHDDLGWLQLPIRALYAQALAAGDDLLWTPQLANGYYLHGEGQIGMYHPLHLFLYRALPLEWAFNLELILSYAWMFPGMFWLLRRLDLPSYASLFGSLVFTFSGFNLLHSVHLNAIAVIAHMPWLLVAIDVALRTTDRSRLALAQLSILLLTGSQLLLGQPQYVWYSALAEGLFVIWRLRDSIGRWRLPMLAAAKLIGVMLGAVQLLPTMDVLSHSVRSNSSLDFVLRFSLHPVNLTQLWSPFLLEGRTFETFKQEAVLYNGAFCTVALVWLYIRRHHLGPWKRLAMSAGGLAAAMLIVALGKYGAVYPWITQIPFVGLLRGPSRYVVLVHFAMATLAAVALTDLAGLLRRRELVPWRNLRPLAGLAMLSVITVATAMLFSNLWAEHPWARYLAGFKPAAFGVALIGMTCALVAAASRGYRWSLHAIVVLTLFDLSAWGIHWLWQAPPIPLERLTEAHLAPPRDPTAGRIYSRWNSANVLAQRGYRLSHGYFTFLPARELEPASLTAQRLAGVRWALNADGLRVQSPYQYPQGHGSWVEIAEPMPRVRMVARARVSESIAEDVRTIDIANTALLSEPVDLKAAEPGAASIVQERAGLIEVATSSSSRQLLILSESYHPGWQATEEGQPIKVMRAYGDFQAAVVGPGERRVVFRFRPHSFVVGAWLSTLGAILGLVLFVVVWRISLPFRSRARNIPQPGKNPGPMDRLDLRLRGTAKVADVNRL
jgi:hypothetical protein